VVFIYLLLDQNAHQDQLYAKLDNGVTSGLIPESSLGSSIDKQMIGKRHKRLEFLKGELKPSDPEFWILHYSSTL